MLRATSLGSVTFGVNTLFIQEQFSNAEVMGETSMSAAGTHIVYVADIATPYITLDSKQYGIITEAQKVALEAMWVDPTTTRTLTYDNATTDTVRMAVEKDIIFTPLFEGSCEYTAIIPLAKT